MTKLMKLKYCFEDIIIIHFIPFQKLITRKDLLYILIIIERLRSRLKPEGPRPWARFTKARKTPRITW